MSKIKVLIVDNSKTMRQWLEKVLSADPDIFVVGSASDPYIARERIKNDSPDVITLDVIMPRMDGITFLQNLMRLHPLPVILISKLAEEGSSIASEALSLGVFDYFSKPKSFEGKEAQHLEKNLIQSIKKAASKAQSEKISPIQMKPNFENDFNKMMYQSKFLRNTLIVMGGSTGGIEAIDFILSHFPRLFPPILIVQHIRKEFSKSLAKRMNLLFKLNIKEAQHNELILPGTVYIAPGEKHLCVKKDQNLYMLSLEDSPPVHGLKPALDVLFRSTANAAGHNAVGIILSGMGDDGTEGAKAIHQEGGVVIAQDESSSVAWGMPGSAVRAQVVDYVVPLNEIPNTLFQVLDEL